MILKAPNDGLNLCWHGLSDWDSGILYNHIILGIFLTFHQHFKKFSLSKERLTSHGGGIGLSSGSSAYTGHSAGSGGRSSGLSSSQHGPSMHQPADFQPPYFPPPFHHPSTHQSPPQQQQQVDFKAIFFFIVYILLFPESSRPWLLKSRVRSLRSNATFLRSSSPHIFASSSLQSTSWA